MSDLGAKPQVRIDPLTGARVIVAAARANRPNGMLVPAADPPIDSESDPFAEGHEHRTPPEVFADRPDGSAPDTPGWRLRCVPNRYPVLDIDGSGEPAEDSLGMTRGMPELLQTGSATGAHELIVNDPRPILSLAELDAPTLENVLRVWALRIKAHSENAAHVHLSLNEGIVAGATIPHTHAQAYALPFVPPNVARERERMRAYFEHTQGRNLLEDLVVEEVRKNERIVAIDESAVLLAPFASASAYRLMIVPRRVEARFEESEHRGAAMLHRTLAALTERFGVTPSFNLWVRTAPADAESFCWRIEIAPRFTQPAGFEMGTGTAINSISPEQAAAELREVIA